LILVVAACGAGTATPSTGVVVARPASSGLGDAGVDALDPGLAVVVDAAVVDAGGGDAAAAVARDEDLIDVAAAIPDAVLDLRYATADNFTGVALYPVARCVLRRAVAARLARAAAALRVAGRRLLLWDCYRPASIQRALWARVPDPRYVARPIDDAAGRPIDGSRHSRGAAVDLGLVDVDGAAVALPTRFDEFSAAAHRDRALRGAAGAEARRLDAAMRGAGFVGIPTEWWHYDAPDAGRFMLADAPL
jgi:D-alanyl-D-alanine dipeptidase